ncbi:ATP synthase F1 subunit gamma [Campylobacter troglodytis]|uniref:ATP synthase F1 subunit gamma n=1 Tax=Campylobacter troglodytis TaxID=654363 RepID=UPI001158C032|nr:ATP synthase F1 subunit gamma [Campylobacter troglodytis]TQR61383.1 F0F1 ATP synthase subunit gamma [Campylobacter troglodytis]
MASLKEIKRKIKSVNNTQKTTKAMKLVSTAKLNRAKEAATRSKFYAQKIVEVLGDISLNINKISPDDKRFELFEQRKELRQIDIIFITADKGLCGGFNIKTIKTVMEMLKQYKEQGVNVRLRAIGKVGIDFLRFQRIEPLQSYFNLSSSPDYEKACEVINPAVKDYLEGVTDSVFIVHNGYKNMISQELKVDHLIPVDPIQIQDEQMQSNSALDMEPQDDELMNELVKTYFEYSMYFALIDSLAAEHSSRMQAMDSATNNAKEMVAKLSLAYNKARQESITTELTEIVSGVESMK